ncbi:MAG TPA: hypothetical protein VK619_17765 [Pyrinomonadaceae bacterium]|nr:hypothetical protein [Pyrinomonadaceae bacterium]
MLGYVAIIFFSIAVLYGLMLLVWPRKFQQFMVRNFAQAGLSPFADLINSPRYLWFLRIGGLITVIVAGSLLYGALYRR